MSNKNKDKTSNKNKDKKSSKTQSQSGSAGAQQNAPQGATPSEAKARQSQGDAKASEKEAAPNTTETPQSDGQAKVPQKAAKPNENSASSKDAKDTSECTPRMVRSSVKIGEEAWRRFANSILDSLESTKDPQKTREAMRTSARRLSEGPMLKTLPHASGATTDYPWDRCAAQACPYPSPILLHRHRKSNPELANQVWVGVPFPFRQNGLLINDYPIEIIQDFRKFLLWP